MNITVKLMLLVLGMAGLCFGCDDQNSEPEAPVEVRFELLNEAGEPSTTFKEGEDIIFDYQIKNLSDREIFWYFAIDSPYPAFPVFRVYNLLPASNELPEATWHEIGPTHTPHHFNFKLGNTLVPHGEKRITVTWLGDLEQTNVKGYVGSIKYPENTALHKGNYYVVFEHAITFEKYADKNVNMKKHFEVL